MYVFSIEELDKYLRNAGFEIELLDYFDYSDYSTSAGKGFIQAVVKRPY